MLARRSRTVSNAESTWNVLAQETVMALKRDYTNSWGGKASQLLTMMMEWNLCSKAVCIPEYQSLGDRQPEETIFILIILNLDYPKLSIQELSSERRLKEGQIRGPAFMPGFGTSRKLSAYQWWTQDTGLDKR